MSTPLDQLAAGFRATMTFGVIDELLVSVETAGAVGRPGWAPWDDMHEPLHDGEARFAVNATLSGGTREQGRYLLHPAEWFGYQTVHVPIHASLAEVAYGVGAELGRALLREIELPPDGTL